MDTPPRDELAALPATEIARRIRTREVSPVEVTEAALERTGRLEGRLHAFTELTAELARDQARAVADAVAHGRELGPLAGVPIAIKDLIATAGIPTRCGSPAYRDFVPDEDDVVVERVRAAGAVVLGKTNVPEFGYSGTGHSPIAETSRNPWDPAMTPGGSSAGSGVAVATGMARWRWAVTAAARSGSRRRTAGSTGSRRPWGGCPSTPAAGTSGTRACPAGSPSSTSGRSPAPWTTRPC